MRIEKVNLKRVFVNEKSIKEYLVLLYGDNFVYCYWNMNPNGTLLGKLVKTRIIKVSWWISKKFTISEYKGVTIIRKESNSTKLNVKAYHHDRNHLRNVMEELEGVKR